ncbi:MAG: hypothetical protein HY075_00595 [Deltaproteobacteria bacterium]|nr:hypothetical protein [Deltaproteobacteria bacterium]
MKTTMRSRLRPLIAFLALLGLAAARDARASLAVTAERSQLLELAAQLDPLKLEKPRNVLAGGYLGPFGIQLHPSCIAYAKEQGIGAEQLENGFDEVAYAAFKAMAVDCLGKYGELKPYLLEWIAQFRRTVITCTRASGHDFGASAMNIGMKAGLLAVLQPNERAGIDTSGLVGSLPRNFKTVIVYSSTRLKSTLTEGDAFDVRTLLHEVLHSTNANNRTDHDEVERFAPGANGSCGGDIGVDRVNQIATMCSETPVGRSSLTASRYLFERMGRCGSRDCRRLFTGEAEALDVVDAVANHYAPTHGLSNDAADSLCAKLYDEGACATALARDGEKITAGAIPELNAAGDELRARLYQLFPQYPVGFSADVLARFPSVADEFRAAEPSPCFQAVFQPVPGGGYAVRGAEPPESANPSPETRYATALTQASARLTTLPQCSAPAERAKVAKALGTAHSEVMPVFLSSAYGPLLKQRYQHRCESSYKIDAPGPLDSKLRQLVGPELFDRYLGLLERFHWRSPKFDCQAARLAPLKGMTAINALVSGGGPKKPVCKK